MDYVIIPDTGIKLYDGDIVMLSKYPGVKWIIHKGWYTYQESQSIGWYFCSIPQGVIIPVTDDELTHLTVISDGGCCPQPPCPPGPVPPGPIPPELMRDIHRAWISVPTLTDRDNLNKRMLPDGKIVRVDEVSTGVPGYFRWDKVSQSWVDETFGIDTSKFITDADLPNKVSELITSDDPVKESIIETVQPEIQKQLEPVTQDVTKLSNTVNNVTTQITTINSTLTWNELI